MKKLPHRILGILLIIGVMMGSVFFMGAWNYFTARNSFLLDEPLIVPVAVGMISFLVAIALIAKLRIGKAQAFSWEEAAFKLPMIAVIGFILYIHLYGTIRALAFDNATIPATLTATIDSVQAQNGTFKIVLHRDDGTTTNIEWKRNTSADLEHLYESCLNHVEKGAILSLEGRASWFGFAIDTLVFPEKDQRCSLQTI